MGKYVSIKCKCQNKKLRLGSGFLYGAIARYEFYNMKNGKYGKKRQELIKADPSVKVDVDDKAYWCKKCGYIESAMCLDLYKGDGDVEDIIHWDDVLLKEYRHFCPICRTKMLEVIPANRDYWCEKCGYFETFKFKSGMYLNIRKDKSEKYIKELLHKNVSGERTSGQILLEECHYLCPICKRRMSEQILIGDDGSLDGLYTLVRCPKCGEKYEVEHGALFD